MDVKPVQAPEHLTRWLSLIELPQVGPIRLRQWYEAFSYHTLLLSVSVGELLKLNTAQIGALQKRLNDYRLVFNWLDDPNHHLLTWGDTHYPPQLEHIHACPLSCLFKGIYPLYRLLSRDGWLATPSHVGLDATRYFAGQLVQAGFVVTSGLAIGIDGTSHIGALQAKGTIAVLRSGCSPFTPKHPKLARDIVAQAGALVSEYLPDMPPCELIFHGIDY